MGLSNLQGTQKNSKFARPAARAGSRAREKKGAKKKTLYKKPAGGPAAGGGPAVGGPRGVGRISVGPARVFGPPHGPGRFSKGPATCARPAARQEKKNKKHFPQPLARDKGKILCPWVAFCTWFEGPQMPYKMIVFFFYLFPISSAYRSTKDR